MSHKFPAFLLMASLLISCSSSSMSPLASPTSSPAPKSTLIPSPTSIPTPDAMRQAFDALQAEGINVGHEGNEWRLLINGEDAGAFFDEDGKNLHIQKDGGEILIAVDKANDRLQLNADGVLLLNDGQGTIIGMFNPTQPEAGWMFFDYKAVNPAEINVGQLSGVSEIELAVDGVGNVHLPEDLIAFENANAEPFPPEAFFSDYVYIELPPERKWFDLFMKPGTPDGDLWFKGEFGEKPEIRPVKAEFIFQLDANGAALLNVPEGDLFVVGCKFMNKPEEVANGAKPFGIMNMLIPGPALRELVEIGYFEEGGCLFPEIEGNKLNLEFRGPFDVLLNGGLFNKQGLKQKDIANMLKEAGDNDVISDELQKVLLLGVYHKVPWLGGRTFDLENQ